MTVTNPAAPAQTPEISVILPIYNVADHVAACLASLRGQSFEDFEVLMVDDGSTDGSADHARAAAEADPRFRLISQENGGLSAARNTGLEAARGTYIAFVDSDDRVMPDYLMQLWQALQDSGADWVACGLQECFSDGSGLPHAAIHGARNLTDHPVTRRYRLCSWEDVIVHFPSAWNKLYRRSLIEGLRFDEGTWFEDHTFFYRAASRTDHLLHLPQALYLQTRGREGQITASDDERVFDQFDVLREMRSVMQNSDKTGAETAFSAIASRLLFERSIALHDPDRRARFARAAAKFLKEEGLSYTPDWDPDIGRAWGLEMAGQLPLSVILTWEGARNDALQASLDSLAVQDGPGHEILLVCPNDRAVRAAQAIAPPHVRVIRGKGHGQGSARCSGLTEARGRYLVFLEAGNRLHPSALLSLTEALLRSDAAMGVMPFWQADGTAGSPVYRPAFVDNRSLPGGRDPVLAEIPLTPLQALGLNLDITGKIFDRAALQAAGLDTPRSLGSDYALSLGAALARGKIAHVPWAGVTREPAKDPRISAVWRAHDALCRGLPREFARDLPRGWQRRLYARALWSHLNPVGSGPRPRLRQQAPRLLRATVAAAWRGLSHGGRDPAGFDPMIGPRFMALLDPLYALRAVWRRLRGRPAFADHLPPAPLSSAQGSPEPLLRPDRSMMLFPLQGTGLFRFRADFHESSYGNITFFGPDRVHVPFHLSLRFEEGLIVVNDSRADGAWRAERRYAQPLPDKGAELTIELAASHVRVFLGNEPLFDLGRRTLRNRRGLRGLETITYLHVEGAVQPLDLVPETPGEDLMLDPLLILRAAQDAEGTCLQVLSGSGASLVPIPAVSPSAPPALKAFLPGRIWNGLPEESPLVLQLAAADGAQLGSALELTRDQMAGRIGALLERSPSTLDGALALTMIEHIRYGALMALLSVEQQSAARALARLFGLLDFLEPPDRAEAEAQTEPVVKETGDTTQVLIQGALERFAQSQRQLHPVDPLRVVADIALPPDARQGFFLALSDYFCREGQDFLPLSQMAAAEGLPPFTPGKTPWANSAMAPYLLAEGRIEELRVVLKGLVDPQPDWVATPALAWVARHVLVAPTLTKADREDILSAFMAFVSRRLSDYWERAHCRELTHAAVQLLLARETLSEQFHDKVASFCLSAYGLSRQFWQMLDAQGISSETLPPALQQGRIAFAELMAAEASDRPDARDRIARSLSILERLGAKEAPRMRLELLGPSGLPQPPEEPLEISGLMALPDLRPKALSHAALRHMAAPNSSPASPDVSELVARHLPDFYPELARAPHPELTRSVARSLTAFVDAPQTPPDDLRALLRQLEILSDPASNFLGAGLALTLVGLWGASQPARAESVAGWLSTHVAALCAERRRALCQSTPVRMSWMKLKTSGLPQVEGLAGILEDAPLPTVPTQTVLATRNPVFDVIVTVFSCRPYLETRIPALRAGWLSLLEELGIPYVVVVGDGDGRLEGDILHLDAPDDYEGLPQKTLATIAWVRDHTDFAHMYKIDDDCFVDPFLLFESLNYRGCDYYGRKLHRKPGQTDRVWHQAKSASERGRFDLDKSPEPSAYADGGSGYSLSRSAMECALEAADSPDGRQLIATSFMEDKLLGDLLALRGIHPENTDYRTSIRRRSFGTATPVAFWQNSFLPSQSAPVMQVHMDTHEGQQAALERRQTDGLWPRKIWPSFQAPALGYQSNALELVTSEQSVAAAAQAEVAVVACMRNEMFMLPHFLAHYRALGVTAFLIADNVSDDGTREYLASQPDVALFSVDTDYRLSRYGVAWQQAMMAAVRPGKWSLLADADELLLWQEDQQETLPDLLASQAFEGADAARIFMLDMYPKGKLQTADFAKGTPFDQAGFCDRVPFLTSWHGRGPFSNMPTWTSALRHRLIPGARSDLFVAQKIALLRYQPWMRLSAGLHFVGDVSLASRELIFAHFKYNADFYRKARAEVARGQHFNDAEEYRKYLALASEGRERLFDPELSVRWQDCDFVQSLLREDAPYPRR